jgi:hypothetical protein
MYSLLEDVVSSFQFCLKFVVCEPPVQPVGNHKLRGSVDVWLTHDIDNSNHVPFGNVVHSLGNVTLHSLGTFPLTCDWSI